MFAPNMTKGEMVHSNYAKKHNIDNTPNKEQLANLERMSWFLQAVKHGLSQELKANVTITITSGFRSPTLNTRLRGSKTSYHMQGRAADIVCSHLTPLELARWIEKNMQGIGYQELINEHNRWVHVAIQENVSKYDRYTATNVSGKVTYTDGIHQ